jgi:hypothetical protein
MGRVEGGELPAAAQTMPASAQLTTQPVICVKSRPRIGLHRWRNDPKGREHINFLLIDRQYSMSFSTFNM